MGLRANDDVPAMHPDDLVTAPLRIDLYDPGRERVEAHRRGNPRANVEFEVHVVNFLDLLRPDGRSDLSLLFRRRSRGRRGGGVAGRGLRPAVGRALGLGVHVAVLAVGVHVAIFAVGIGVTRLGAGLAVGIHIAALAVPAFGLHVLGALGIVTLGAHALRLLARHSFILGSLALGRAR